MLGVFYGSIWPTRLAGRRGGLMDASQPQPQPAAATPLEADALDPEALKAAALEDQEQELAQVRAELEDYQRLIEDLPAIYEGKFSHKLREVAQDIRRLLQERDLLQEQIDQALAAALDPPPLVAASPAPAQDPVAPGHLPQPPLRLVAISLATAIGVAVLVGLALRGVVQPRPAPVEDVRPQGSAKPGASPAAATSAPAAATSGAGSSVPQQRDEPELRLRAKGDCWLEVQSLDRRMRYVNLLRPGQSTTIPLGGGLRLRAGRPDLLEIAMPGQSFRPLGPINAIGWRTLVPARPAAGPS